MQFFEELVGAAWVVVAQGGYREQELREWLEVIAMLRRLADFRDALIAVDVRAGHPQKNTQGRCLEAQQVIFETRPQVGVERLRVGREQPIGEGPALFGVSRARRTIVFSIRPA